jgi:uncharacterized protein YdhG (YjbR/CyaY superfamily)
MRRTPANSRKPATVDEYLAAVPDDQKRAALQTLRRTIKAALPRAEECISYGLPAFRYEGRMVAWYGAAKNHCSFYPGGVVDAFKDDLTKYETSKGTIRFTPDEPLPATLVKKLLKARIAVNARAAIRS